MRKVLVANRGEIAVRIIRACRDEGIDSVAVYTEPDRDAPHARLADEAFLLVGPQPSAPYLDIAALLAVAARAGADAVHPGYGFLSENAEFAQAVLDAGLTWIGPPPHAIRRLGDKVAARRVAREVGAPLVPGSPGAVSHSRAAVEFARVHGVPIAIKAAHGGGGRGMRVAWTVEEIPERFDAAVREAGVAFGRSECFVERYLDRPRHVETQCLADAHGTVVVVSTRDCSVQRRHQKLIEEAPAPFLSVGQRERIVAASKAIMRTAGYVGAGTCEFLLAADGTLSFLEVNTRLQVEHPVTEEVTGVDLVCEQLRIARGERLSVTDPEPDGHAIEFRINAEDPGRNFLPCPGLLAVWEPPSGPGVRVDSGVVAGCAVAESFDSMLAKLIVKGRDRDHALRRARRALAEFRVDGLPTVLAFHRLVVEHPDFAPDDPGQPFAVHTRWIETELAGALPAYQPTPPLQPEPPPERERITLEVDGRRVEVAVPVTVAVSRRRTVRRPLAAARVGVATGPPAASGATLTSPMQGTVVKVAVEEGQPVTEGDLVVVLEAMKMEQPVFAHRSGSIADLRARVGATLAAGAVICEVNGAQPS
jgi:acetyl-CoA/propionyl-CoA/long-chain acyl-CoA carboxylase, biotin carboxylase, biotin carboxyl carrier protein